MQVLNSKTSILPDQESQSDDSDTQSSYLECQVELSPESPGVMTSVESQLTKVTPCSHAHLFIHTNSLFCND
jgi:hypothetical protein